MIIDKVSIQDAAVFQISFHSDVNLSNKSNSALRSDPIWQQGSADPSALYRLRTFYPDRLQGVLLPTPRNALMWQITGAEWRFVST